MLTQNDQIVLNHISFKNLLTNCILRITIRIIKDMKPYLEMSESTLYTILKRLEAGNMLTVRSVEHEGRLRKYYHITREGLRRIEEFKEDWKEINAIYNFITREETGNE